MTLATQLEPGSAVEAHTRGDVLELAGRRDEAREAYREAIRRSADDDFADRKPDRFLRLARPTRVEALRFIESELTRQVIFGDGLLAFADRPGPRSSPADLLATLRKALESARPLARLVSALIAELSRRACSTKRSSWPSAPSAMFPLLPRTLARPGAPSGALRASLLSRSKRSRGRSESVRAGARVAPVVHGARRRR